MRVLIHHYDAKNWREPLRSRLPGATVSISDDGYVPADYLVAWLPPVELLEMQTQLKAIVNLGAGVDALLRNPALPGGVPIVKLRDAGMASRMIDYVRYGVLHYQRNFDRYLAQEQHAEWQAWPFPNKADWPVGVLGLGAIGSQVAQALADDGHPVHGWSRTPRTIDGVHCHHGNDQLPALLANVRTLITLLPDTPETRGMVNAEMLARLPEGATLINPGRGTLIDETDLLDALGTIEQPGRLRGAMLDVFADEPLAEASELWRHPRVRVTPHVSAPTPVDGAADQIADVILALDRGEPVDTVDVEAGY